MLNKIDRVEDTADHLTIGSRIMVPTEKTEKMKEYTSTMS